MNSSLPTTRRAVRMKFHWSSMIFILLIVGGLGAIVVLFSGRVIGSEFSPSTFQIRDYMFYRLPFIHLQITPTFRWESGLELTSSLKQGQFITTGPIGRGRWDLVHYAASLQKPYDGPAHILAVYLQEQSSKEWSEWTKKYPDHAKHLWSAIQELALEESYPVIPRVFDQTHSASQDSADTFAQHIVQQLAAGYFELAHDDERRGDSQQAIRRYRLALKHRPDWPEAQHRLRTLGAI